MPKLGDIAICHQGYLGVITSATPIRVRYGKDAPDEEVWEGIKLGENELGKKWLSKKPKVVGNLFELLENLNADG